MTNILQMQEILKSVPDQRLMQEMQQPTGRAPQYLVMTEIQRRKKVRDEYQGQVQDQQTTVAEDMVMGPAPQQPPMASAGMPPQMSQSMPPQMPQSMPPQMQPPMAAAQPPMNMEGGGALYRQAGSQASQYFGAVDLNRLVSLVEAEAGNQDDAGKRAVAAVILNRTLSDQFPNTIEAVAEQRTPGGSYQFSPLINTRGDVDQLPAGSAGTRAAVLDLLADFDNKNPVGDALYFQNPEISGMIFPALRGNYDNGKRNNKPFPDGVTKIGDHVFSTRYGNEEAPEFEPVAFRVEDNALTDVDKKRLGTEEALKITGAGEEVIMAESEPAPVPPSSFRGGIAGIPEKITERTGGFRGPSFAETLQQAPLPQEQLVGGLDAFIPPARRFTTKPREQVIAETLAGIPSPDANLPAELSDAAALAGSGLPIGEVLPPAPRSDVVKRLQNMAAATKAAQMAEDPLVAFGELGVTGGDDSVAARLRPFMRAGRQPVDTGQAITSGVMPQLAEVRDVSPDANLPVAGYDPDFVPEPTFGDRVSTMLASAVPPPTKKGEELLSDPRNYLVDQYNRFATELAEKTRVDPRFKTTVASAAIPAVDPSEFEKFEPPRATASIDPVPSARTVRGELTPAGLYENLDPKAYSDPSAGEEVVAGGGLPAAASPPASGAGTTTAVAPTGGMADLLAQIQAGRDDAKAMGLLTAGLGIMQQASQPGATLLSSIPGAAAGVKQYSADKANLAKQQLALATLANQQRATDIAAERAAKPDAYERYERDVLADFKASDEWEKYFFDDGTGKPGRVKPTVRSEIRKTYTRTLDPSLTGSRLMQTYVKYEESKAGQARLGQIRKALIAKGVNEATAFREAPLILRREFLSGGSAPASGNKTNPLSFYDKQTAS